MKAINNKEHQNLLYTLEQLSSRSEQIGNSLTLNAEHQQLSAIFQNYQSLLSQLSSCITEYEHKHHYVRVNIVGPALRRAQKEDKKLTALQNMASL